MPSTKRSGWTRRETMDELDELHNDPDYPKSKLTDAYVRGRLRRSTQTRLDEISQDKIDAKRASLERHRARRIISIRARRRRDALRPSTGRHSVKSSWIAGIGYNQNERVLEVEYRNGTLYRFIDVPLEEYEGLMNASSHGSYFSINIWDVYRRQGEGDESQRRNTMGFRTPERSLAYRVLGVTENSSKEEVRRAYIQKSKIFHPDKGGNEDAMKRLNEAYELIKRQAIR